MTQQNRRSFLANITGVAACGAVLSAAPPSVGLQARQAQPPSATFTPTGAWDLAWLDTFKGRHKQLYDLLWHALATTPSGPLGHNTLAPPKNYLDVHKELSRLEFPDVNVVIGINMTSFPINASDALWAKFKLGDRWRIQDPTTGQPATRNIYLGSGAEDTRSTVRGLQARGAIFWMCNLSLNTLSADLGRELNKPPGEIYSELVASLNPGTKIVPAHTWAVGAVQERGFTYEKL